MEENKRRPNIAGRRKRSHMSIVALLFFFFCCFVLICVILTPDKTFSESENRSLAVRPKLTAEGLLDGSWFTEFNSWFSDQFPARDGWIVLNYFGNVLSGKKETDDIYAGKDGYLLAKPTVPTEDALKQLPAAMNEFHEKNPGLKMSMLIVPDAATILEEKLPANAPVRDQLADIAEFTERVSADIRRLDAATPLSENSSEYIYYRTDHHWTSQGAQIVFLANAEKLGIDSPVVYVPHYLSNSFEGTLASRTGNHFSKDTITAFEPQSDTDYYVMYPDLNKKKASILETEMLDEKDQYTVFFGGNHALVEIRTTADNGRNLLVLKDSYANCFIQFLTPYYDKIIMVDPRYYYDDLNKTISNYGITDLLYLYSADMILADTTLTDVLETALAATGTNDTITNKPEVLSSGTEEDNGSENAETGETGTEGSGTEGTSEENYGAEDYITDDYSAEDYVTEDYGQYTDDYGQYTDDYGQYAEGYYY